jgi:hypothetical protein
MQHLILVVPVDANIREAQHVAYKDRPQRQQVASAVTVRHLQFQHYDGDDDDGENAVAE